MMISDMLSKHVEAVKSVLKKWFKINDIKLVHLLIVWYLVNLQDARCNNKDMCSQVISLGVKYWSRGSQIFQKSRSHFRITVHFPPECIQFCSDPGPSLLHGAFWYSATLPFASLIFVLSFLLFVPEHGLHTHTHTFELLSTYHFTWLQWQAVVMTNGDLDRPLRAHYHQSQMFPVLLRVCVPWCWVHCMVHIPALKSQDLESESVSNSNIRTIVREKVKFL